MKTERGCLIAVEGVARSGKSTFIKFLANELQALEKMTMITEWNSYPQTQEIINHKKTNFTFTPITYSTLHLADFSLRYVEQIRPALDEGKFVIADRWYYTAFTRDVIRGVDQDYVTQIYRFAREPDLVFYLDVPVEEALKRHRATKAYWGYNSGTDIWPDLNPEDAFVQYYEGLKALYEPYMQKHNVVRVNGLLPLDEIASVAQKYMRELVVGVVK